MKIVVILPSGRFMFKTVNSFEELTKLSETYENWMYV